MLTNIVGIGLIFQPQVLPFTFKLHVCYPALNSAVQRISIVGANRTFLDRTASEP